MKKNRIILALVAFFNTVYSQYDYFQWTKTASYSTLNNAKIAGSGIAVDQYDRVFYLVKPGSTYRVFWNYGELYSPAADAASTTNMIQYGDNYGDHLFYITSNNRIGVTEFLYTTNSWSYNNTYAVTEPIAAGPSIASEATNKVYYIRASDMKVCNFYKTPTTSGFSPVLSNAPSAASLSNLVLNNDRVFYITASYQIGCLQFDWVNGWQSITVPNGPAANAIAPGSKIQVTGNLSSYSVFFIGTNQKVYQYYCNTSVSGVSLPSGSAPLAKTGTDIVANSYNEVRYVDVNGNIQSLFMNDCDWSNYTLNASCNISDPSLANGQNNKMFFYSAYSINKLSNLSESSGFVYKKRNKLMLNGSPFNAIGINYVATLYSDNGGVSFYPSPTDHYANDWSNVPFNTQALRKSAFDQHLADIASLGFNSIRFNGFHISTNTDENDPNHLTDPNLYITYTPGQGGAGVRLQLNQTVINRLFQFYDDILTTISSHNLKVKFFIGLEGGNRNPSCMPTYAAYLQQFANHFKNNPTIYSYAILQEADINLRMDHNDPTAFMGKGDICYHINNLYNAIRSADQNHLVNLSVVGSSCVFNFDPAILNVDFFSIHPYPLSSDNTFDRVKMEIQWMSTIMKSLGKPWIVGETGYPGNNGNPPIQNTGSYADQKNYAQFILNEAFSAGASGVAWWQYRNVFWPTFASAQNPSPCCPDPALTATYPSITTWDNADNYYGLRAHNGSPKPVIGGPPLAQPSNVFLNYIPQNGCTPAYPPANYYNSSGATLNSVSGTIKDVNGVPIKDASIQLWEWETYAKTEVSFSHEDGSYLAKANFPIGEIRITAPGFITSTWSPQGDVVLNRVVCGQGNARTATSEESLQVSNGTGFMLFPNPSNGIFTLKRNNTKKGKVSVDVTDLMGRSILKKDFEKFEDEKIDLSGFNSGIYFIQMTSGDYTEVKKAIKK